VSAIPAFLALYDAPILTGLFISQSDAKRASGLA